MCVRTHAASWVLAMSRAGSRHVLTSVTNVQLAMRNAKQQLSTFAHQHTCSCRPVTTLCRSDPTATFADRVWCLPARLPACVCDCLCWPDFSKHAKQPGANILLELAPIMTLCLDTSGGAASCTQHKVASKFQVALLCPVHSRCCCKVHVIHSGR
jgi:hypothetical protein